MFLPVAAFFAPQETPRPSPSPELLPDPPHFLNTYSSPLSSSPPLPDPSPLQWLLPVFTTSRRESVLLFTLQLRFRGTRACCDKAAVRALRFNEAGEKYKADFDSARAETGTLMVVDFFATWCGPCKAIAPQVVKMSSTYPSARFYKIDVDEVPEVAQELSIRAMPTFVLFKDGQEVATVVGANPTALEAAIKQHV
ncbi:hypothetical protein D6C90_08082 [Aureobasidium pullulans]|uniref:Thioredoxin domain-containing protein n=1 Tax=Aureobasidium pullulans TaxID=5580 RepID=A0A4S9U6S0_AURPU|nr:hypothetical protein D6C91_07689 [Aureobasidium pullulans]THZ33799.1 hypothetical protein D6C90_08082 [Aureobasidium pullulans]